MNMQSLMAQAQKMQKEITKKKDEIDSTEFTGKSEWVEIKINGKKELLKLSITKSGTIDEDDKEMLEDMLIIALKDAFTKVDKEVESKLGSYGQSLNGLF